MKKIFRMALVFALAGATLLYTSCTKDYAPDILEVQKKADALDQQLQDAKKVLTDVQTAVGNLQTADTELQKKIDDLEKNVADALADLGEDLYGQISDIQDQLDELNELLGGEEGLAAVLAEIAEYMGQYFKFIQSIAYVPDYYDGYVGANAITLTDGSLSDTLLVATFKVTPAEAVARVTEENASVEFVATRAAASAPEYLLITKLVYRDDAPGYVDVYAVLNGAELTYEEGYGAAIALDVTQEVEEGLVESVTSDFAPLYIDEPEDLIFAFADAETGDVNDVENLFDTEVTVKPSSETDSLQVFTPERWITVGLLGGEYLPVEDIAEVLNAELPLVSPVPGDTIFYGTPFGAEEFYSDNSDDEAFGASVWPTRPGTVVDILNNEDAPKYYHLCAYLENGHVGGPETWDVIATYNVVPDTVAFDIKPVEAVAIPWDYKYWDDIADTTIENIGGVPDDINSDLIADPDETPNVNVESEIDYADGVGEVVANEDNTLDATIASWFAYGEADSTFTFTAQKYNAEDATVYAGSFDYVVKARPADLVLDLGSVDTTVCFEKKTWFNDLQIVKGILDNQPEYLLDGKYEEEDVLDDIAAGLKPQFDSLVVYLDGEKIKWNTYSFSIAADGCQFGFKLDKVGAYEFHLFDHAFGIKYEFVLTVNAANNPAEIAPKNPFITIDNEENKDYSVQAVGDYDEKFHYYIKEMHLKDYLKVIDYAEGGDSLILATALATPEAVGKVKEPLTKNNPTALERLVEDPTTANLKQKHTYQWAIDEDNKYDSLQFKVAATLIPYANQDFVVDSATVRLWTVDPVPVFKVAEEGVVALHHGAQYATAGVLDSLTVQDLNGYDLVGKVGDEYKLLEPDGVTVFDYDQEITVGEPVLVSGAGSIEELRLKLEGTQLILQLNQGVIVNPIVVKVPVTLKHMLCPPKTVDVYVTFKEKE